jgi:hypothetical protein
MGPASFTVSIAVLPVAPKGELLDTAVMTE